MSSPHVIESQILRSGTEHAKKPPSEAITESINHGESTPLEDDRTSESDLEKAHRDLVSLGNGSEDQQGTPHGHAKGTNQDGMQRLEYTTQINAEGQDGPEALRFGELRDDLYLDPTPRTPRQEVSPSRGPPAGREVQGDDNSKSEIQSIMDQFDEAVDEDGEEENGSPHIQTGASLLDAPIQHPPRRSSLEPLRPADPTPATQSTEGVEVTAYQLNHTAPEYEDPPAHLIAKTAPKRLSSLPSSAQFQKSDANSPSSPKSSTSLPKMPPPLPDPEPDLPFDFHRFLEQLRHRTADPVAKFLRSFLTEFGKKQWMVHEQVKIINDFLTFITSKMAQCEVWRGVSDAEFDNAKEGMEKLVMNRLYAQTFSPAIQPPAPVPGNKGKRKNLEKIIAPGRRGQHQEDIERDEILGQKVRIYGWVQEEHLDIPPVGDSGRRFLVLAQQGTTQRSEIAYLLILTLQQSY
jgi:hypothetical protein